MTPGEAQQRPSGAPATPRVSVTMPAYNAEATLLQAVQSALAQTVSELELIVVDDGSPVPAAAILSQVSDPRLRILRHEANRGLAAARNTALAAARAPLLAQLDADDLWEPDYLESVIPLLDDPEIGLAYCNAAVFGAREGPYIRDPERHPIDRFPELARTNPIPGFVTIRTSALRAVGGYAPFLWGAVDYYMYMSLAAAGWRFAYLDRVLAHYRWAEGSMSHDWDQLQRDKLRLFWAFARRHPRVPGPRVRVLQLALREAGIRVPGVRGARNAIRSRVGSSSPAAEWF